MTAKIIPIDRETALRRTLAAMSAPGGVHIATPRQRAPKPRTTQDWFLRGPFPGSRFEAAAALPGKALAVWLLIHHQRRLRGGPEVTLPTALLFRIGVEHDARPRALRSLEAAGLITVIWAKGRAPRIRIVEETK